MTPPRMRFVAAARREFHAIGDEYDAVGPWLGHAFGRRFDAALRTIRDFPEAGTPYLHDTRRLLLAQFPYSIVYRAVDRDIVIVAVPHHRQKPGYWKGRRV